jgi:O-antigen ligase
MPPTRLPLNTITTWVMPGLPWLCLVLMPFKRLVGIPVLTMAGLGLWLLAQGRIDWRRESPAWLFSIVFASVWIAMAVSLLDAVEPTQTLRVVVNHLRFYLGGLFIIYALSSSAALGLFLRLSAWLLIFWLVDAVFQWQVGVDLFGQEPVPRRITGPFGPRSAIFGIVLAVLAPLLVEHARAHWPRWALAALALGTLFVVFVSGTRSAWVCALVVVGGYWALSWVHLGRVPWRVTLAGVGISAVLMGAAISASDTLNQRFFDVVHTLSGERLASPLEHRAWIWRGGWAMFLSQPLNGVGARGFRYAFATHAAPDDPYMAKEPPVVPAHAHHVWLEILAETGVVGLAGLLLAGSLLVRAVPRVPRAKRPLLIPFGLALACVFWPLNTHLALFSAVWSQFVWWLVALYCAAYGVARAEGDAR